MVVDGVTPILDQNVSMTRSTTAGGAQTYFYTHDGLGSVRTITDTTGSIQNKYDYHAFGEKFDSNTVENVANRYQYTGREFSQTSGLQYNRWRMYNSGIGRFIKFDPNGYTDSANLYTYVTSRPLMFLDSYGLKINCLEMATKGNERCRGKSDCEESNKCTEALAKWFKACQENKLDDPYKDLDEVFNDGLKDGAMATADGFVPFVDPFADKGMYDTSDPTLQTSHALGEVAFTALSTAVIANPAGINYTAKVEIHAAHHTFGKLGKLRHIQATVYRAGVKGSHLIARLPLPIR